jgi:hypothetical protein
MVKITSKIILYIIIFLLLLYILSQIIRVREGFQSSPPSLDLVVARYEEDISWIKRIPENMYSRLFIYNKGSNIEFDFTKFVINSLPNYGRESHSYLSHIIDNYDTLGDITLFIPGSALYRDDKRKRLMRIIDHLKTNKESIIIGYKDKNLIEATYNFSIDSYTVTNEVNRKNNPESKLHPAEDRPLGKWFNKRFSGEAITCVSFTGIFAASRDDIRKRPVEFYKRLLDEHLHVNPEVVHYIERTWKNILSIDDSNCIQE